MNLTATLRKSLTTSPTVAAAAYAGLVLALLAMVVSSIVDILGQREAVAASAAMLEQLEGRKARAPGGRPAETGMPSGSAFLEGATVTVAGAALLQRVAGAVTKLGGNVLSSQLDVQGTPSKAGFVSMVASCELDQPALQPLSTISKLECRSCSSISSLFKPRRPRPVRGNCEFCWRCRGNGRVRNDAEICDRGHGSGTVGLRGRIGDDLRRFQRCAGRSGGGLAHGNCGSLGLDQSRRHGGAGHRHSARAGCTGIRADAERQSAVGHAARPISGHARPADLFAVAAATAPLPSHPSWRRRWPLCPNQGSPSVRSSLWSAPSQATRRGSGYFWINRPRRCSA